MAKRTVKEVLTEYHNKVPFPLSIRSIRSKGYDPADYLLEIAQRLEKCEDSTSLLCRDFIAAVDELRHSLE